MVGREIWMEGMTVGFGYGRGAEMMDHEDGFGSSTMAGLLGFVTVKKDDDNVDCDVETNKVRL